MNEEITLKSHGKSGRVWKVRFECREGNGLLILQYAWAHNAGIVKVRRYRA